jgi:hypothetical protein
MLSELSEPRPGSSKPPATIAQALEAYIQELTEPTWRSRGMRCPHCKTKLFRKAGWDKNRQRFRCKRCDRYFYDTTAHFTEPEKSASPNTISLIRTTVLRVLTCGLGGPVPEKSRMSQAEQAEALRFLETIEIGVLLQANVALDQGLKALEMAPDNYKVYHYQLRQWVNWLREQTWLPLSDVMPSKTGGGQPIGTFGNRYKHKVPGRSRSTRSYNMRPGKPAYALREWEMPERLRQEITEFRQFRRKLRDSTFEEYCKELTRFLGWWHRFEGIPREDLTLEKLIPLVPLQPKHSDLVALSGESEDRFLQLLVEQQYSLDQQSQTAAQQLANRLERYYEFQSDCLDTQHRITRVIGYFAEFVYRHEINRLGLNRRAYLQIPVIKRIRDLQAILAKRLRTKSPEIPFEKRSIPWRRVFDVLKAQQRKADEPYYYFKQVVNGKEYLGRNKRKPISIAKDHQKFLILLFFVALPPDRVQGIQALELGKTLIQGTFETGEFIPIERMAEPYEARWYIKLKADQYKSGKAHGNYWGEVPNVPLGRGKTFYDYLEAWITEHRPFFKPDHDFLFVKTQTHGKAIAGEPITTQGVSDHVKGAFSVYTGVTVAPQSCRSMFVSYLNQIGAAEAELEAAAAAMKHQRSTQRNHYDRQDKFSKTQPAIDYNCRLFDQSEASSAQADALPLTEGGWVDYRQLSDQQLQRLLQQVKRLPKAE